MVVIYAAGAMMGLSSLAVMGNSLTLQLQGRPSHRIPHVPPVSDGRWHVTHFQICICSVFSMLLPSEAAIQTLWLTFVCYIHFCSGEPTSKDSMVQSSVIFDVVWQTVHRDYYWCAIYSLSTHKTINRRLDPFLVDSIQILTSCSSQALS